MTADRSTTGLTFDLPDGWWCLDVRGPRVADRVDQLLRDALDANVPGDARARVRSSVTRLAGEGAQSLLLRPGGDVPMVRRLPPGRVGAIAILQITYLVCADGGSVLLTFAAADEVEPGRVIREVARIVSAARVVR